jgi:hypothetical protein
MAKDAFRASGLFRAQVYRNICSSITKILVWMYTYVQIYMYTQEAFVIAD